MLRDAVNGGSVYSTTAALAPRMRPAGCRTHRGPLECDLVDVITRWPNRRPWGGRARASSRSSAAAIRGCPASGRLWRGPGIAAGLVGRNTRHGRRRKGLAARFRGHGRDNIELAGRNNRDCAVALGRDVIRPAGSTRPRGGTASLHYSVRAVRVTQWARHRRGGHSGCSSAMVRTMSSNLRTGARSSAERRATSPLG